MALYHAGAAVSARHERCAHGRRIGVEQPESPCDLNAFIFEGRNVGRLHHQAREVDHRQVDVEPEVRAGFVGACVEQAIAKLTDPGCRGEGILAGHARK